MHNVIILLEIFFGLSGIYFIIASLNRLKKNNSQSPEPHSSIQNGSNGLRQQALYMAHYQL